VTGPLSGVRIADLSRVLAGPYATMLLGDLGAEVIKVERPGVGDDTRSWGPPYTDDGMATYFAGVNRNKDARAIDLSTQEGRAQVRNLIAESDVVVENFRPGALAAMGLGYDDLAGTHPGLIYCSISGFGSGLGSTMPGYDLLVQAMGGLMSVTGPAPGEPTKVGVALVDVITGLHATVGILAALHHRDVTGQGQHLEVNLLSSLLSALVNQASAYVAGGVVPGILGNAHPSIAPYEVFATADRPIVIAVGNDGQFRSLVTAMAIAELADDARFATNPARVSNRGELKVALESALGSRSADEWQEIITAAGVPCGPINDLAQAFALAQSLGLDPIIDVGGVPTVAHPIRLSKTPAEYRLPPPPLP